MKGTKEITICDMAGCARETQGETCDKCDKAICYEHAWRLDRARSIEWGLGEKTYHLCADCVAKILPSAQKGITKHG